MDMAAACRAASQVNATVVGVDRHHRITWTRALYNLTWSEVLRYILPAWLDLRRISKMEAPRIKEEIMKEMKEAEEGKISTPMPPSFYKAVVDERDKYFATHLRSFQGTVVAVVGKGHVEGIARYFNSPVSESEMKELEKIPSVYPFVARAVGGVAVLASSCFLATAGVLKAIQLRKPRMQQVAKQAKRSNAFWRMCGFLTVLEMSALVVIGVREYRKVDDRLWEVAKNAPVEPNL